MRHGKGRSASWISSSGVLVLLLALAGSASAGEAPLQRPRALQQAREAGAEGDATDRSQDPPQSPPEQPPPPRITPPPPTSTALTKQARSRSTPFPHRGFVTSFGLGTQGCFGTLCSSSRHGATPGVRLDGFVGGNIRGWAEIGLAGGWGTLGANVGEGTNALSLYGLDPALLQQAATALGNPLSFDLGSLVVEQTKLRMARVGPLIRIHFIPRGRMAAWVGTGVGYSLFRARYQTLGGDLRVDLHGLDVPVQGGVAVHVHEHVAVGAQFDYLWTWYGLASLSHPDQSLTAPITVLESAAAQTQQAGVSDDLPSFWTLTFGVRARL